MREICTSGSMSGCGNGATAEPLRHRQTKGAETDMLSLTSPRHTSTLRAPCQGGAFQWVQAPPGKRSSRKQPEQSWRWQNGWSLRCSRSHIGDRASVRAATRVNAEQTSKRTMCRPTRQRYRGRLIRLGEMSEDDAQPLHRGSGGSTYTRKAHATREAPSAGGNSRFFARWIVIAR